MESKIQQYIKNPIKVEAIQYTGKNFADIESWIDDRTSSYEQDSTIFINTLEGVMSGEIGSYIIKGIKSEFYPCKKEIFDASYSLVTEEDINGDSKS